MAATDPQPQAKAPSTETARSPSPSDLAETNVGSSGADSFSDTVVPAQAASAPAEPTVVGSPTDVAPGAPPAAPRPAEPQPKKVAQLGDFRIIKKLGQGGMGTVYLARQVSLDRHVALKTLSKELAKKEDLVKRFIREARSMARLQHPNVVQVYAADSKSGVHFAAIEYIDGKSMQAWMNELGKLSVGDALYVTLICADALRHAHEQNMIHRDIKPDNILVTSKGVVKVADFGLAKALDEDVSMTQSGTGLGTPLYMAPEQARNAKHVDQRSDIYALGSTLYYFLTGKLPFSGDTTLELILAKEKGQFTPSRRINPQVPEKLDLMIDKMMAKDPQYRYADCAEIIRDLQSLNLANSALSFIDGAQSLSAVGPVAARSQAGASSVAARKAAGPTRAMTSAADAARKAVEAADPSKVWFVQYTDAKGKANVSKMTTVQVQAGIKSGMLGLKAKAKSSAQGTFLPLAQYPEFTSLVQQQVTKQKAESRSADTRAMFAKLDKQERRRRRWRWLRNLVTNVKGIISLIIYLAIIFGLLGGAVYFGLPYLRELLNS